MQRIRNNHGKLSILIVVVLLFVMVLAGTGFLLLKSKGKDAHAGTKRAEKKATSLMPLQEFVVNLADMNDPHYLKLEINLSVTGEVPESGGEGEEATDPHLPIIRDTIITCVSRHTYNELLTATGKERLKTEILLALNKAVPSLEVEKVYFVNFAMQ